MNFLDPDLDVLQYDPAQNRKIDLCPSSPNLPYFPCFRNEILCGMRVNVSMNQDRTKTYDNTNA